MIELSDIINAATTEVDGGSNIDLMALAVALVTVAKAGRMMRNEFQEKIMETWDNVQVKVHRPTAH